MAETKKFEEAELAKLKDLQDRFNNIVLQLGQVNIEMIKLNAEKTRLENVKTQLETDYATLRTNEQELAKQLTDKYGAGVLDPQTGNFTPQAPEQSQSQEQVNLGGTQVVNK